MPRNALFVLKHTCYIDIGKYRERKNERDEETNTDLSRKNFSRIYKKFKQQLFEENGKTKAGQRILLPSIYLSQ